MEVGGVYGKQPIGMFDSGIGGLTVLKAIMEHMPDENIVYFGDTARLPYGTKSRETVTRFSEEITRFLMRRNIKLLVIACNTASAYALTRIRSMVDIPVIGVIEPGARAAAGTTRNKKVGVIGTRATIASGAYLEAIQRMDPAIKVFSTACPLFVPLVEEGWTGEDVTRQVARRYLEHLVGCRVDSLILGCTHYPLIKKVIGDVMGRGTSLIDSAEETAATVENVLKESGIASGAPGGPRCEVFVSDLHLDLRLQVERFLGFEVPRISLVNSEFEEVEVKGV
ncbi:MAG: glutamate racemase [bacterium]|jgi:glutamate racemase